MTNFNIDFTNPWLLLLLVPAFGFTLFSYFRLNRKYRCTRNRVTSIVLHLVVMVLSISILAGSTFNYEEPNTENEILVLVDCSYSNKTSQAQKDAFVEEVLLDVSESYAVGVVKFGYNQVCAVPMTHEMGKLYQTYLDAPDVNDTGSDIAAALEYAKGMLTNYETSKIVLLSDGIETDGNASQAIASLAISGIKLDTVCFPNPETSEVQVINAEGPDYNVLKDEEIYISVSLQSTFDGEGTLTLYDNGIEGASGTMTIRKGITKVAVPHVFTDEGLHALTYKITSDGDTMTQNNSYCSYMYLEVFDKILILESNDESEKMESLLNVDYNIEVRNISEAPTTLDELRAYDQVILMNIAASDLPEGFDKILYSYVYDIGGGLFTIGGAETDANGDLVPHAYDRYDMKDTLFAEILPVTAIDYTPPLGVMIIIDRSGSMDSKVGDNGETKLSLAREGAKSCLWSLNEMDWCGVMTLETSYATTIAMTPVTQKNTILNTIDSIEGGGGGTIFSDAIEQACRSLSTLSVVERRHIILVTDGQPGDSYEEYAAVAKAYNESAGITLSVVCIGGGTDLTNMKALTDMCGGRCYDIGTDYSSIPKTMREELQVEEIKGVNMETFQPTIKQHTNVVNGIKEEDIPTLDGFFGTKVKEGAEVSLVGKYVPIYAEWEFGKGAVGSFMCDLDGTWSSAFLDSPIGQLIIDNIIVGLLPSENIRPQAIDVEFITDNYRTQASIFTELAEGETVELILTAPPVDANSDPVVTKYTPNVTPGLNRIQFETLTPGVYEIVVNVLDAEENVKLTYLTYMAFSYSEEYNAFPEENGAEKLASLANIGKGETITEPHEVLNGFVETLHRVIDPRIVFMIIALTLFLADIAVRKFKFKWPHEIIRDMRNKTNKK